VTLGTAVVWLGIGDIGVRMVINFPVKQMVEKFLTN
jgi:hypothetical protein